MSERLYRERDVRVAFSTGVIVGATATVTGDTDTSKDLDKVLATLTPAKVSVCQCVRSDGSNENCEDCKGGGLILDAEEPSTGQAGDHPGAHSVHESAAGLSDADIVAVQEIRAAPDL